MNVPEADSTVEIVEIPEPTALEDAEHRLQDYQDMAEEMRRSSTEARDQAARLLSSRQATSRNMVSTLKDVTLKHLAAALGAGLAESCIQDATKKRDEVQKELDLETNWQPPSCTMPAHEIHALRSRVASLRQQIEELRMQYSYAHQQFQGHSLPPQAHHNHSIHLPPHTHLTPNLATTSHYVPSQNCTPPANQMHKNFSNNLPHPNHKLPPNQMTPPTQMPAPYHKIFPNGTHPNNVPPPASFHPNESSFNAINNVLNPK